MARFTFIVLAVVVVVLCAHAQDECGPNAVWVSCGRWCRATCESPSIPRGTNCPAACRVGCQCTGRTVLRKDGKCVPRSECNQNSR